jgi:hypothetical protein
MACPLEAAVPSHVIITLVVIVLTLLLTWVLVHVLIRDPRKDPLKLKGAKAAAQRRPRRRR